MKSSTLRSFCLGVLCAVVPLPLVSQSALVSAAPSRIVAPMDETNLVPLRGNVHPLALAKFDRGVAPASTPTGRIMLVLQRSAAQQQALTQYLSDVQNANSPNFHRWLTPAQYGARFSIADSDLQTVESWLQAHGFTIEKVPQARNVIEFSGTFDQIQNTFHTAIHTYAVNGQTHFANATDPQIPAALAPVIAGVGPLNDFHPKPNYIRGQNGHWDPSTHSIQPGLTLLEGTEPFLFVDPADAATIYDTPNKNLNLKFPANGTNYDGTGVTIGIAGEADIVSQDIANYRTGFLGESTAKVNLPTVVTDGNDPGINGATVEALLDNEVAGGIAPGAKIIFYTSAGSDIADGLFNAIFRAIDDNNVSILNISFGECEA
ncbi:MAG: protease pro-enzyme activation domain-containing protein, partial [Acidobacteriaceae bacterium]